MKLRLSLVIAVLAVALSAVVAVAAPTAGAKTHGGAATGTWSGVATTGESVAGTYTVNGFKVVNGVLTAFGTATATTVNGVAAATPETQTFSAPVTSINGTSLGAGASPLAAAAATGSCQILTLTLGPLHLDLLGLVIDLNQVNLNITAQQGSGNLLGNLLCAVAGLLDNTGTGGLSGILQGITNLLNQILAAL
jgi:hypothetical protein